MYRRLGSLISPNQSRPLNNPAARDALMSKARHLYRSEMDHVSIKPDLTKTQQEADRILREEAKSLNAARPCDARGSFSWKVVGYPGHSSRRLVKSYLRAQNPNQILIVKTRRASTHPAIQLPTTHPVAQLPTTLLQREVSFAPLYFPFLRFCHSVMVTHLSQHRDRCVMGHMWAKYAHGIPPGIPWRWV